MLSPETAALNRFALRLLAAMPPADAQVVSPYSVACALAMVGLGARGQADAALRGVLGIGGAPGDLEQLAMQLRAVPSLAAPDTVQVASALWPDHTVPIEEAYLAAARALFDAELSPLDLTDRVAAAARVNRWVSELQLWLPKVTLDSEVRSLVRPLRQLGATLLFSPAADLSGLTSFTPAYVSDVLHRATIEVDEHGTVAAAATATAMVLSARGGTPRPIQMRVDRPYLMLIRLRRTGAILFASTVTTPPAR